MTPNQIKQARHEAGLTQSQMAEMLHVSLKTVQAWEYGQNPIPWAYFKLFSLLVKPAEKKPDKENAEQ